MNSIIYLGVPVKTKMIENCFVLFASGFESLRL